MHKKINVGLFIMWILLYCKCFDKHAILETSVTFGNWGKGGGWGELSPLFYKVRSCVVITFSCFSVLEKHDTARNKVETLWCSRESWCRYKRRLRLWSTDLKQAAPWHFSKVVQVKRLCSWYKLQPINNALTRVLLTILVFFRSAFSSFFFKRRCLCLWICEVQ